VKSVVSSACRVFLQMDLIPYFRTQTATTWLASPAAQPSRLGQKELAIPPQPPGSRSYFLQRIKVQKTPGERLIYAARDKGEWHHAGGRTVGASVLMPG
jgi:hypothetical protein